MSTETNSSNNKYEEMGFEKDLFGNKVNNLEEEKQNIETSITEKDEKNDVFYNKIESEKDNISDDEFEKEELRKEQNHENGFDNNNEELNDFYQENSIKEEDNSHIGYNGYHIDNNQNNNYSHNNSYPYMNVNEHNYSNQDNRQFNRNQNGNQNFYPNQNFQPNQQSQQHFNYQRAYNNNANYLDNYGFAVNSKGRMSNWPSFLIDNTNQNLYTVLTVIATFSTLLVGLLMSGYYIFGLDDSYNKTGFGKFINWVCFGFSAFLVGIMGLFIIIFPLFLLALALVEPSSISTTGSSYTAMMDYMNLLPW